MIKFDYEKIMQPKTVVHCDTEEKAKNLLKWAYSISLKWSNDDPYLTQCGHYDYDKDHTCYNLYKGTMSYKAFYLSENYKILTYEDAVLKMKYKLIKPLSGQLIYESVCEEEFEIFTKKFGFRKEVTWNKENEDFIVKQNGWIRFLTIHKYIELIEEEIFYSMGDRFFNVDKDKYILSCINKFNDCLLINLDTGRRYTEIIRVNSPYKITENEFKSISAYHHFTKV